MSVFANHGILSGAIVFCNERPRSDQFSPQRSNDPCFSKKEQIHILNNIPKNLQNAIFSLLLFSPKTQHFEGPWVYQEGIANIDDWHLMKPRVRLKSL